MSDNVAPDLPDSTTPKTENEVMEIKHVPDQSQPIMEVPSGPIVVEEETAPESNEDADVQETAPGEAVPEAVPEENKTEKAAPVEQPKLAEEFEAIVTGTATEATPVAETDRRIRSRSSRYSDKDFICPKPTAPPKKRSKKN